MALASSNVQQAAEVAAKYGSRHSSRSRDRSEVYPETHKESRASRQKWKTVSDYGSEEQEEEKVPAQILRPVSTKSKA